MSGRDGEVPGASSRASRFDAMYRERIDPWNFRTSDYERAKYRATLDALPRGRYARALEIGCSIGELARALRGRCDAVLGLDVSAVAIAEARRAHGEVAGLHFEVAEVPRDWPSGTPDLVVLSEVLYFLVPAEIDALAERVARSLAPGGHCVAVCWLGETDGRTDLSGDEAGARFAAALCRRSRDDAGRIAPPSATSSTSSGTPPRDPRYRLDVFERTR